MLPAGAWANDGWSWFRHWDLVGILRRCSGHWRPSGWRERHHARPHCWQHVQPWSRNCVRLDVYWGRVGGAHWAFGCAGSDRRFWLACGLHRHWRRAGAGLDGRLLLVARATRRTKPSKLCGRSRRSEPIPGYADARLLDHRRRSEGLTPRAAAAWASLFGASTLLGRLTGGVIIDRLRIHAALLLAIVMAAESIAFIALGTYGAAVLILALPVFGLAVGAEADCLAYCILRIFGRRYFGTIFAVLGYLLLYIGTGLGAVLFSATRDLFDSYERAFYVWAGLAFLGVPLFLAVARTPFFVPATDATGDRGGCSR